MRRGWKTVRRRLILRSRRQYLLARAIRRHRRLRPVADRTAAIRQGDLLAFVTVRNERVRLPWMPAAWASQSEVLAGFARLATHDMVLREEGMTEGLAWLSAAVGADAAGPAPAPVPAVLDDAALRRAARAAYQRDYVAFGFADAP